MPVWKKILKAFNPVKLAGYIYYKIKKRKINNTFVKANKDRDFDDFRENYIKQSEKVYYSYDELVEEPPEADIYIVGSDQVWNFYSTSLENIRPQLKAYFLDFGKRDNKRIAYAASFGKEKLNDEFIREISLLLKKFEYVSVREKSGLDICRLCGVDNAEWVPDPTLFLKAADYRALYMQELKTLIDTPYCLLYMLNNDCNFTIKSIYDWAERKKLAVIYVAANDRHDLYKKLYPTICEWLYLVDNAKYVITNSFHGSVLSIIFQKNFGIIPLIGDYIGMNSRFHALFEMFGFESRFIDYDFGILDKDIDWKKINEIINLNFTTCNAFKSF
jgi:hypothetical protein